MALPKLNKRVASNKVTERWENDKRTLSHTRSLAPLCFQEVRLEQLDFIRKQSSIRQAEYHKAQMTQRNNQKAIQRKIRRFECNERIIQVVESLFGNLASVRVCSRVISCARKPPQRYSKDALKQSRRWCTTRRDWCCAGVSGATGSQLGPR